MLRGSPFPCMGQLFLLLVTRNEIRFVFQRNFFNFRVENWRVLKM